MVDAVLAKRARDPTRYLMRWCFILPTRRKIRAPFTKIVIRGREFIRL
jgi:hypothetical protein